jgi:hypothetical protein
MAPGEEAVFRFFDKFLRPEWEIYIQPHLNGLRPDFVLLNPNVGIAVFEVKDWNLHAMHYFTKDEELWAEKDGQEFCIQKDNPIPKVNLYKDEIFNLYCPRLGSTINSDCSKAWAGITAGVIFPFEDTTDVLKLLMPFLPPERGLAYQPVSGKDALANGDIQKVFPEHWRTKSYLMTEEFAEDLRGWLREPDFNATQRKPLRLDQNQRVLTETRTDSGYRRIKGPAGSGKSLVLAARASRLMNEGKSVLIATYNITLWHYLRDLIVRGLVASNRMINVEFVHFHMWCKRVCESAGWDKRYDKLFQKANNANLHAILNEKVPALAEQAIERLGPLYDAILVDEAQDYLPFWWNVLRKACKKDGEMVLVADPTQDIYDSAKRWTDEAMHGAGFRGPWSQLNVSYRMPPDALSLARAFAQQFLPRETAELPEQEDQGQESLFTFPCTLCWVQCSPEDTKKACVEEILALMHVTGEEENGLANADIIFLADSINYGAAVVQELKKKNLRFVNTFGASEEERRRQKMGFFMGDARFKATTLHSFKGWEARLLVVHVTQATDYKSLALVYAALTRLKRDQRGSWLTVVCSSSELYSFGLTWPSHKKFALGEEGRLPKIFDFS